MPEAWWRESSAAQLLLEERRLLGMREMTQHVLERWFGPLDEVVIQAIWSAGEDVLVRMLIHNNLTLEQARGALLQGASS